jgi:hypothetical protein
VLEGSNTTVATVVLNDKRESFAYTVRRDCAVDESGNDRRPQLAAVAGYDTYLSSTRCHSPLVLTKIM